MDADFLESSKFLTYKYLGQPLGKSHEGLDVTRSIIDELISRMRKFEGLHNNTFILAFRRILPSYRISRILR